AERDVQPRPGGDRPLQYPRLRAGELERDGDGIRPFAGRRAADGGGAVSAVAPRRPLCRPSQDPRAVRCRRGWLFEVWRTDLVPSAMELRHLHVRRRMRLAWR